MDAFDKTPLAECYKSQSSLRVSTVGWIKTGLLDNLELFWQGIKFAATFHMLFMVFITCFATFMCAKGVLDFSFDTSMNIVAVGTIFPLVFSVQASFTRREKALHSLGAVKADLFAIYLMFKNWDKSGAAATEAELVLRGIVEDIINYMRCDAGKRHQMGNTVYDGFSKLAIKMHAFIPHTGYSKPGEGGLSRMQQYLRDLIQNFEMVRAVRDSETLVGLRLFCFSLIHVAPVLLAPYWNHFCDKQTGGGQAEKSVEDTFQVHIYGCESGYFVGVFYVLIVLTLYRVQYELEDPFDGDGMDDIKWERWSAQLDQMANYGEDGPALREKAHDALYQQGT